MKTALVITNGYFGDILFESSVAKPLKEQQGFDEIHFCTGFPQMVSFLECNPYINKVWVEGVTASPMPPQLITSMYDTVYTFTPFSLLEPPPQEAKRMVGITNPTPEYETYIPPHFDKEAYHHLEAFRNEDPHKPIIAVVSNWQPKSFLFTKEEYDRGIDVPYLGYGGKNRDITFIVKELYQHAILINVGMANTSQFVVNDVLTNTLIFHVQY